MEQESQVTLTADLLKTFVTAKIFKDHKKEINCIDFSDDGTRLISCDDQMLNVYDTENGKKLKTLFNKVKEIEYVKFTHHNEAILCATKKDYLILYWSLHDNEVVKIFQGHTDQILSLEMNPNNDLFLTTSKDQTMKLWNLQSKEPGAEACLDLSSKNCCPVANFDPMGLIFAVAFTETLAGTNFSKIALYDLLNYSEGSFKSSKYQCGEIKQLKFSNNGQQILCATAENFIMIVDAYQLQELVKISDFQNDNSLIEASFTPDSNFVISGSENGIVHVWDAKKGTSVVQLQGHFLKSSVVKFSPKSALLVSGCKNLIFWLPRLTNANPANKLQ